jgi:quercetin dioxygenase-like cupin family protein
MFPPLSGILAQRDNSLTRILSGDATQEASMTRTGKLWMGIVVVAGLSLTAGAAWAAEGQALDFQEQLKKGDAREGFTFQQMVKTPEYTVGAVAVKDEIKMHRHNDGNHVLYIVSGQGTATLDGKQVSVKPGTVLHIPKGVVHNIKAEGGELTLLDMAQPPFDPSKMEWVK